MKPILTAVLLIAALPLFAFAQENTSCASFQDLIKATYNFKPSKLTESERSRKSLAMDKVWNMAIGKPKELLPCLRASLNNPDTDPWFLFDGSNLLVELDPSHESKTLQVRNYSKVDIDDVNLQIWVELLARRGFEGFDVSEAGNRWLSHPFAFYILPIHGLFQVKAFEGALFIFGSMDEAQATPALLKIVSQTSHSGRENALWILMKQATPESLRALKQVNTSGFSEKARFSLRTLLNSPELIEPRVQPKTTRKEFLHAFQQLLNGQWDEFLELVSKVPDGERDVVATLKVEDLPLIRKVRRRFIANSNQHAIEFYDSFTNILMTMMWRAGLVQGESKTIVRR